MKTTALLGNPNIGKTSLFNTLTDSYEYVGNWSGVTVEKKIGTLKSDGSSLIDLPGVYSLTPFSNDEAVVIRYFLQDDCTNILNVVDASQLERNLTLTVQLMEIQKPMVIALNLMDIAKKRGIHIDIEKLSTLLNHPVQPIIARTGEGCDELTTTLKNEEIVHSFQLDYGDLIEHAIEEIVQLLPEGELHVPARWLAIQMLDGNRHALDFTSKWIKPEIIHDIQTKLTQEIETKHKMPSIERWIYEKRRLWIHQLLEQCVSFEKDTQTNWTERIDKLVTHPLLGTPIFLLLMLFMFKITFDWIGSPLSDLLDQFLNGPLTTFLQKILGSMEVSPFINALIFDGIISGVGGVLVFVPQIFVLFFFISLLEDSGYMARAALVMDRMLEKVGLNGKAFIPMIIGLGCNVPGVMAARTIEQPKERLITILITPLMSCSARLPVYALFTGVFFKENQSIIVFSLYMLGIGLALIFAKVFSKFILKNDNSIFVIELPPYRVPQFKTLWRSTWDKGKGFIRKAGTFIFGGSVVIWFLTYAGPSGFNVNMDDSFLALIGGVIAPLLIPLGFGTWQAGAALLTGFMAKEVVVATLSIIYHVADTSGVQKVIMQDYTPVSAISFMVFILLYTPCIATVAAIHQETQSKKWTAFSVGYALILAYTLSILIYQIGNLFF